MEYLTEAQQKRIIRNQQICKMFSQVLAANPRMSDRAIIMKIKESGKFASMSEVTFRSILRRAGLLKPTA